MKFLITIVPRGMGEDVSELLSKYKIDYSVVFLAEGTATKKMLDYLSLENSHKEVIFSIIDDTDEKTILKQLDLDFGLSKKHIGMAFTMSMNAINRLGFEKLYEKGGSVDGN